MSNEHWQIKIAMEYLEAGVSIIPVKLDGTKSPWVRKWTAYQSRLATSGEAFAWFYRVPRAMGVIGGAVSGGLEVMDFDGEAETIFPQWHRLVEDISIRLPLVETPSGGYHVYYRCSEVCGNRAIAKDSTAAKKVLIETRGQCGYVVGVSSPAEVHKTGNPYVQVAGPVLPEIPTITPAERLRLWQAARSFDRDGLLQAEVAKLTPKAYRPTPIGGQKPWERFDAECDWDGMLRADGWSSNDGTHWVRPGKSSGPSATLRQAGGGDFLLHVFSSSIPGLEVGENYSASAYLAYSRFGGDFTRANQHIREGGR